jgi:hypothetical protein
MTSSRSRPLVTRAAGGWQPGEVAYQLATQVYRWFGHTDEDVPYVEEARDATRSISKERILADG